MGTGERGTGLTTKRPLHFQGAKFHRIIPGFMAQGGDFELGDGRGGESVYGGKFNDEQGGLMLRHTKRGLLSMANAGPDTNGSQFFILFKAAQHLNGKHCVFGEMVDGDATLDAMEGRLRNVSLLVAAKLSGVLLACDESPKRRRKRVRRRRSLHP